MLVEMKRSAAITLVLASILRSVSASSRGRKSPSRSRSGVWMAWSLMLLAMPVPGVAPSLFLVRNVPLFVMP